jgi:hypothetical protein
MNCIDVVKWGTTSYGWWFFFGFEDSIAGSYTLNLMYL